MHALALPPIADLIFSFSSPMSIVRVGRSCRIARQAVTQYLRRAYSVNRLLLRFFTEVLAFRMLQARTGTLITGSVALQFFDRDFYPSSDLDLCVHMRHRREIGRWLLQNGYRFVPASHQAAGFEEAAIEALSGLGGPPYGMPGVAAILNFVRYKDMTLDVPEAHDAPATEGLKVQLIISRKTPMEVVLGFHSSQFCHVYVPKKSWTNLDPQRVL